jgi:hypothetical protein
MARLAIALFFALAVHSVHAHPVDSRTKFTDFPESDPRYQEIQRVISQQSACFKREALSKFLAINMAELPELLRRPQY